MVSDKSLLIDFPGAEPVQVRALKLWQGSAQYLNAVDRWVPLESLNAALQGPGVVNTVKLTCVGRCELRAGDEFDNLGPEDSWEIELIRHSGNKYHGAVYSPSKGLIAYHTPAGGVGWHYTTKTGLAASETHSYICLAGSWFFRGTPSVLAEAEVIPGIRSRLSPLAAPRLQLT
jgi:hypothetical protein